MKMARIAIAMLLFAVLLATGSAFAGGQGEEDETQGDVIEFWAREFEEYQSEWLDEWTAAYNDANPDVTVEITYVPSDAWDEKMTGAQAVGETPDVVHYSYNQVMNGAQNGELLPVSDYMDESVIEDLYPNVRDMVTMDDKVWAYPQLVEPSMVLYYHKDMFEEVGLDPEQPPRSWDELLEYAELLTTEERYGLLIPSSAVELGWTLFGQRYGVTGHRLISDDWSESLVVQDDSVEPGYVELAEFWKSLYDSEVVPRQGLGGYVEIEPFAQERAAMAFNGSWGIGSIKRDFPELVETVGVTNAPTPEGNYDQATASLGGWSLGIDAMSDKPDLAADYIAYLLGGDTEIMTDFFTRSGFSKYTARTSVDDTLATMSEAQDDPWMVEIAERVVPYAVSETFYPFGINIAFGNAMERVYLEDTDIEEAFRIADEEIENIIENESLAGSNPMED